MTLENFVKLNIAGGVAGLSAWIPVYPFDTVKTRMQVALRATSISAHLAADTVADEPAVQGLDRLLPADHPERCGAAVMV